MTDEQRRTAEITFHLLCTDDERRWMLAKLSERRAMLLAQRAEIEEQLQNMKAILTGQRAALAH